MFLDVYQPAMSGAAASFVHSHAYSHPGHLHCGAEERPVFQVVPINHSPEEIRAMVRDILG